MRFDAETPSTLFVALADPPADREDEFNEWYDTVHGPDALANGSFLAVHRFRATGPGYRAAPYLALWEGRFGSEAEAWAYIGPRAQALRDAGRAGEVAFVRFALMLLGTGGPSGAACNDVGALTTVQNDWRSAGDAPAVDDWWREVGLDAVAPPCRWLATSDAAGRGPGFHLAVFAHDDPAEAARPELASRGAAGSSPLPPYETIFGDRAGGDDRDEPAPATAWVAHWEPVTSLRA
jgi:hypothetical protein